MSKDEYIREEVSSLLWSLLRLLTIVGVSADILLSALDYFVTPENFSKFFVYRLTAAFLTLLVYFIVTVKKGKYFNLLFVYFGFIVTGAMVEAMILSFGGHQSIYYVGMGVILVLFLGFLPLSLGQAATLAALLYAIYIIPIILTDKIVNVRVFINNNIFLLTFALGGLSWRYFSQKVLINKISLQYDLEEQKKHLETYSLQLSSMVEDRTAELNSSVQRHQALFENATDGIIVMDLQGTIVNANERACEMHGFSKEALVGIHSRLLEDDEQRYKTADRMRQILAGESLVYETTLFKKDGTRIALEVSAKAIPIADEMYIQSFLRDITERKRAEAEKARYQTEREKILKDLHDGIGGLTTNIRLLAEMAQRRGDLAEVRRWLATISELASESLSEIRNFLQSLDVKDLTWQTVAAEFRHLGRSIIEPHGIQFSLVTSLPEDGRGPTSVLAMNLFRIYKESLANIVKHARATGVAVGLSLDERRLVLEVRDNGVGLPGERGKGRGLLNMQARAAELGGSLAIEDSGGTTIVLTVPLS